MDQVTITWEGGVKYLEPIKYELVEKITGPWWWRKTEYEIHSPYGVLSGIESREQALSYLRMARR